MFRGHDHSNSGRIFPISFWPDTDSRARINNNIYIRTARLKPRDIQCKQTSSPAERGMSNCSRNDSQLAEYSYPHISKEYEKDQYKIDSLLKVAPTFFCWETLNWSKINEKRLP